jgi:hypothetical protein
MTMRTLILCLGAAFFLPAVASAQALVTRDDSPGSRNTAIIYYDNKFLFMSRNYGNDRDVGGNTGNTQPGFFVHSKAHDYWLQIVEVSTKDGKFGKSTTDNLEDQKRLVLSQIGWDFTEYAKKPSIELPLRAPSAIAFPEKIELDANSDRYRMSFFTSWGVESAATRLYVSQKDLTEQFDKILKPVKPAG